MRILFILLMIIIGNESLAQERNLVWVFGDSAGIDFGSGTPIPISSSVISRGSCVSISDNNGDLLFYAFTRAGIAGNSGRIYNKNHVLMDNGDSLLGQGWYQELVIVPDPAADSSYYIFSIGVTNSSSPGLFYSKVVFSNNNINGIVTQKNIQLQSFKMVDCINAVKHGNGRDWWVIFRKSDAPSSSNDDFFSYLITPSGIQNVSIQTIGAQNRTNLGHIVFTPDGTRMAFSNLNGVIDLFNFDRCTGLLSNYIAIEYAVTAPPEPFYWSCEFSPDASKLYVSTNTDTSYIFQYDLNAVNIPASKDTIWVIDSLTSILGAIKLAPDNKIYLCNQYYDGFNTSYPYPDSVYNVVNMNLSVINFPDSLGASCDFQPFSFYLGGKRAYKGLPNNPDYELGPLVGSLCDSLVGIGEVPTIKSPSIHAFYHSAWEKVFINASGLNGNAGMLMVYDIQGKVIFKEPLRIQNGYYTKDLSLIGNAKGAYLVVVETEKEQLVKKFVIE